MIKYLLQEMEKSPNPLFTKRELLAISIEGFKDFTERKILNYCRPSETEMENLRLPRCQHGCQLTVIQHDGAFEAVCLDHPEEDPILIERENLNRYILSTDMLLTQLRSANMINGDLHRISGGFFNIGHKFYNESRVGFIFIPNIGNGELVKLKGLKHLCDEDDVIIVFTPASGIEDVSLKNILRHEKIVQVSLYEYINTKTFELPIEKFVSGLLKPKAKEERLIVELSGEQRLDYEKFDYLCYDKVHILGTIPMKWNNLITINENKINIGDYLFILFLRFVVELKKGNGGWLNIYDLESEGIITDSMRYQIYSNLRTTVQGSLIERNGQKFIQSDGSKHYRISTHPDLITYNKKKLLLHQDKKIKDIIMELL
ncbi:MAG: hypothetical protein JW984_16625 [Deltaproteobacteria bacterium]|uniref:Uncharacterized protein n=1 Tax=Candidatus Zymogenus saltonus TaxID=2844893 RepID=A0A9D8KIE8_9DELT|nr:hypothetical protein [Candidatus Zymogenus saltonus]